MCNFMTEYTPLRTISRCFLTPGNKKKLRKGVLRNFVKFTGKNLRQSLFFNKVADLLWILEISKNTFL